MQDEHLDVELRDGTHALIRPIRPDDKDRLRRGLAQLSAESRYLRFHTPLVELTEEQLTYLTEIDYRDHMAWVALDPEAPDEPGMAVARYVRLEDDPGAAEAAITVADDYQGRGLGSVMLGILARSAREQGIQTFRSYVLEENTAMLRIFERLGAERVPPDPGEIGEGVVRIDLPLPAQAEGVEDSVIRRVLRYAASRDLPQLPLFSRPIWRELRPPDRRTGTMKWRQPDRDREVDPSGATDVAAEREGEEPSQPSEREGREASERPEPEGE